MASKIDSYRRIARAGDLVGYMGKPALVVEDPVQESFIGALVEIICSGKKMKVPLGMIEVKRYKDEDAF